MWNDPDIGIVWPLGGMEPILSDRDGQWSVLAQVAAEDLPEYAP